MTNPAFQVLCIGNAIVDILARVDDAFLETHERVKGSMMLVSEDMSATLYAAMPPAIERSGGSASNTAAGIASFGGRVRYVGKVRDDQLGTVFRHDIKAAGVAFDTKPSTSGEATATSMILVTPDSQRTMNTYLGACGHLTVGDIDEAEVSDAAVTYIEGYLWDRDAAKEAVLKAINLAHQHGRLVSMTLSDSFCVDRFRAEFLDLAANRIDILFANEAEIMSLFETDDFEKAVSQVAKFGKTAVITRSEKGAVVVSERGRTQVPVFETVVDDTTGAGDLFASGFLYGFTKGYSDDECARLGCMAAAEVISHLGARPEVSLAEKAQEKGLFAA